MNIKVVIPARYNSSRFNGKPLALINRKEMILHVCEIAASSIGKKDVIVITDDLRISDIIKLNGYEVVMVTEDCVTGTDRIAKASPYIKTDLYINLQGDEPLIDPKIINMVIEYKIAHPHHVINCMAKTNDVDNKNVIKIVCNNHSDLLYASRNAIPYHKLNNGTYLKQVCVYAYSPNELVHFGNNERTPLEASEDIEILRFIEHGQQVKMLMVESNSHAVDTPEDIAIVENILMQRNQD